LANTTITAPFRGRVADVSVEIGQFVRTGEQLLSVDAIDAAEIVASFQPQAFGAVTQAAVGRNLRTMAEIDASRIVEYLIDAGVTASVRLDIPEFDTVRSAELVRFRGTIDSETGTIGMAVRVDDPLTVSGPRRSPPLSIGSFVSVTLTTRPPEGAIAIPRAAVHQTDLGAPFVYVADADDRLTIKPIVPGPVTGDRILIRDGLIEGDRLILSDPRPPIVGMALTPVLVDTES
jgi:multidrug efflux pump subunit AcrA (membrane-fusion protein)